MPLGYGVLTVANVCVGNVDTGGMLILWGMLMLPELLCAPSLCAVLVFIFLPQVHPQPHDTNMTESRMHTLSHNTTGLGVRAPPGPHPHLPRPHPCHPACASLGTRADNPRRGCCSCSRGSRRRRAMQGCRAASRTPTAGANGTTATALAAKSGAPSHHHQRANTACFKTPCSTLAAPGGCQAAAARVKVLRGGGGQHGPRRWRCGCQGHPQWTHCMDGGSDRPRVPWAGASGRF